MPLPFEERKPAVLVKRQAKTDQKYGCRPEERLVKDILSYGIVNVNKPAGPTSHQVSAYVKRILGVEKSGHSGTLDPNVTGVLAVGLGRATRIVEYLLTAGKEYVCLMHLHDDVASGKIYNAMKEFSGRIKQMPPLRSAIKRQLREREIYYLDILEIEGRDVLFRAGCQAGTYIRKLVHDMGKSLGVGAHMQQLVRTKAGPFTDKEMVTLQDLEDALWYWRHQNNETFIRKCIRPIEEGVNHLEKVWVLDSTVEAVCHGALVAMPGIAKLDDDIEPGDTVALMTLKDELIACGTSRMTSEQMMKEEKGIAVVTDKVFMLPGTYPKISR